MAWSKWGNVWIPELDSAFSFVFSFILGVDSDSILFNHRYFLFFLGSDSFLNKKSLGRMEMDVSPRFM